MKILHLCLGAFYIDNYSYQENILPKYHKKLGYDVSIIASLQSFDSNGNATFLQSEKEYINEYGIKVIRVGYKAGIKPFVRKLKIYNNVYENIEKESPNIIFIHGSQFSNMNDVVRYIRNNEDVKVFVDNHCDYSNSATNWFSKNILHRFVWKHSAKLIEPYTDKFYGVLPARVDFLVDMYKLPNYKVELLVMGADDEKVIEARKEQNIKEMRKKYNIKDSDFLIMTGGKIDSAKRQTIKLMEAVKGIDNPSIKLIVFGSVTDELRKQVLDLSDGDKIKYIGWINAEDSYKHFAVADLVVFPGRHSVFWEQVAGIGIPMLVKYWEGTTHVDLGGNVGFLYKDSVEELKENIISLINSDKYKSMKHIALTNGMKIFSYNEIAKKSIHCGEVI